MKRRDFIKQAGVGAVGAGVVTGCAQRTGASAAAAQPLINWQLASSFPRSLDTIFGAAEVFSARVKDLTNGKFNIRVFPAGELVPGLQVLDAVQNKNAQMGHTASYYYIGKNEALAFDTAVPFGMTARQQSAWYRAGGMELMRNLFADFNIINFQGGNTGVQMGGWFRNPVENLAGLKGLKMRIPGLGGKVMADLGVTVQNIAGGDIFSALDRGAIDATEWVGPYDDMKLGFYQVAKNYYYPGWWEPGPALSFYVNKEAWERLPESYQSAIEVATAEASVGMMIEYDSKNPAALKSLVNDHGVQLKKYSDDIMNAANESINDMCTGFAAKDLQYKKIYDHWSAFKKDSAAWFSTAEQSYTQFAYKA